MDAITQPADLLAMFNFVLVAAALSAQQMATIVVIVGIGAVLLIATRRRVARSRAKTIGKSPALSGGSIVTRNSMSESRTTGN